MPRKISTKPCRTCGKKERSASGNCLPCQRTSYDKWSSTHKRVQKYYPGKGAKNSRSVRARYPVESKARRAVERAVRSGKLIRPMFCQLCLGIGRIEAHHEDYTKQLEVVWLCSPCHKGIDGYKHKKKERTQ